MKNEKDYYLTTAITYTSGKPHIGNTYEIILADAIARFKRQEGYNVYFQTGTDEHGEKIELKAKEAGKTPKQYVDEMAAMAKELWAKMDIQYDDYIQTTEERHEKIVQKIFDKFKRVQSVSNLNVDHEGSGLGLYIAKGFIELHNGSISVVSEVEKGSTFIITIPIVIIKNDLHNINHMDEDELNRIIKIELSDL